MAKGDEKVEVTNQAGERVFATDVEGLVPGNVPLKVVTGTQSTSGLNFDLKPGAIVAHPGSTVIFVCG
jgi:hypothetical protein